MDKKTIRQDALLKRQLLKADQQDLIEEATIKKILNHDVFLNAKTVGLYYPIKGELNLLSLLSICDKKSYYLPNIENDQIIYRKISHLSDLIDAPFGLKEVNQSEAAIDDCDLYLIPCVATAGLLRIGYGKGYFDRYLKDKKGYKLGITYPTTKYDAIEKEPFDVLLDEVL